MTRCWTYGNAELCDGMCRICFARLLPQALMFARHDAEDVNVVRRAMICEQDEDRCRPKLLE